MPKPLSPHRRGTGSPLHIPWQRHWRRQAVLATWHCGAFRSPASLSCASSPAPPLPAIQPQRDCAQQCWHHSPSPPRSVALGEQKKMRRCFCFHRYTPKWTGRKRGREGTDKFWITCRGEGSAGWLWSSQKVVWLGPLSVGATTAVS